MPAAKAKTAPASRKAKASPKGAQTEFVVLKIGAALEPGSTVTFVGAAGTMEEAVEMVNKLADSSATRLAILEKKSVVHRRPAMSVEVVEESIAKTKP